MQHFTSNGHEYVEMLILYNKCSKSAEMLLYCCPIVVRLCYQVIIVVIFVGSRIKMFYLD